MDINKVDLLLKYIFAAAGQEDSGNREVGPIHLVKYVYLADLNYAEKHGGKTFTGAPWKFHQFGPWSPEVFNRIDPVVQEVGAEVRSISSPKLEEDIFRFSLVNEDLFEQLERDLPLIMTITIRRLIHLFGDDTTSLLHHVYRTRPMLEAAPGELLSFKMETVEEEDHSEVLSKVSDVVELYRTPSPKKRKADMKALKEQIQCKLAEKKLLRQQIKLSKPPRYDDVFFEGVKWLDSLAGDPVQEQEGKYLSRKIFGNPRLEWCLMYPEDTIQSYVDPWWKVDETPGLKRGRLIKGFLPHVSQIPMVLIPIGRSDPTDHQRMHYKLEPLKAAKYPKLPRLPVAALPLFEGEVLSVYKAKKRPLLVVSIGGPEIPKAITIGSPKWQTMPAMLVAPFYGAVFDGRRAGFSEEFVRRVRRCEYPQYLYDNLPEGGPTEESILRLDHIQPFPLFDQAYQWTPYCLSEEALMIMDEWFQWLIEGSLSEDRILGMYRDGLREFDIEK